MKTATIRRIAAELRERYGDTSDPDRLCRETGVLALFSPMGDFPGACKGFIVSCFGHSAITVNSDLDDAMARVIFFHELSHFFLHISGTQGETFQDFSVFDRTSDMEYEANLLAAELMLTDEAVYDVLNGGADFYEAAAVLKVPPEILDFKLRLMRSDGIGIPEAPIAADSCFLGR